MELEDSRTDTGETVFGRGKVILAMGEILCERRGREVSTVEVSSVSTGNVTILVHGKDGNGTWSTEFRGKLSSDKLIAGKVVRRCDDEKGRVYHTKSAGFYESYSPDRRILLHVEKLDLLRGEIQTR